MPEMGNPNMYLIYVDESYDETHYAYSAIFINAFLWNQYLSNRLDWRKNWFDQYGIPLDYELHATKFVGGRGEHPANRDKLFRADLFYEAVGTIENMDGVHVINAITSDKKNHLKLFEHMLNRINRTLKAKSAMGILICDEGNENRLTSIVRKMKKENHIPYNTFGSIGSTRNIPLNQIIEDPLFKTSKSSYFIQLSDFIAFSLLRNEKPLASTRARVSSAFDQLDRVLIKEANRYDSRSKGIVRVYMKGRCRSTQPWEANHLQVGGYVQSHNLSNHEKERRWHVS